MAEPFSLEDMGYSNPAAAPAPQAPGLTDFGYELADPRTGQKVQTPQEVGMTPEEAAAARQYINSRPDPRTWGEMASDTWNNVKRAASAIAPTAIGGEGAFGISSIPGAVIDAAKAPGRMMSGEVQMFGPDGRPTEEGIAESMKFTGLYQPGWGAGRGLAETVARNRIYDAIRADERQGRIRGIAPARTSSTPRPLPGASAQELNVLAGEGVPVSAYDLSGGPNTRRLVETSSNAAHDTAHAVGVQQEIAGRAANAGQYLATTLDGLAGRPLATGDEFRAAVDAIKATNDPNYTAVMSMPQHAQVFSPALKDILERRPVFRRILSDRDESMRNAGNMPPPIYNGRGQLNITASNAPSLEYLDSVYRVVRERANQAFEAGDKTAANDLKSAANALRAELDNLAAKDANGNSTYKAIRDDASEVFGAKNALEAGYKFVSTADPMKLTDLRREIGRYSPGQREQFRVGLLARLKDEALKPNGFNKVASYLDGSNAQMAAKIEEVLGNTEATRLGNQARLQRIVNQSEAPVLSPEAAAKGSGIGAKAAVGLGAGAALAAEQVAEQLPNLVGSMSYPFTTGAAIAGGAAAAGYGVKKLLGAAKNAYEARVAQAVLDAVTTRDPIAIAALDRMPPKTVKYFVDRLERGSVQGGIYAAGQSREQPTDVEVRPQRASGGRIKTNPISAEVKRVRTLLSHKTANILSMPDDAVATALHIAKGQ